MADDAQLALDFHLERIKKEVALLVDGFEKGEATSPLRLRRRVEEFEEHVRQFKSMLWNGRLP